MTAVLFVAAGLACTGLLTAAWRRDVAGALAGLPALGAGAAIAAAGASRYAPSRVEPAAGQELAVLVAAAVLALVAIGAALVAPPRRPAGGRTEERRARRGTRR